MWGSAPRPTDPTRLHSLPVQNRDAPAAHASGSPRAVGPPHALSWVSVQTADADALATVLPWHPAVSLRYDQAGDTVQVATSGGVHRVFPPLALFSICEGPGVHRVIVARFDGGLDLIDVASPTLDRPKREGVPDTRSSAYPAGTVEPPAPDDRPGARSVGPLPPPHP